MLSELERRTTLLAVGLVAAVWCAGSRPLAQAAPDEVSVRAIDPGSVLLQDPDASRKDHRFAFIVYGDTRGPADGIIRQPQHGDVVDTMVRTIARQRELGVPVRFVIQTGDGVSNGRVAQQWNVSFTPIIERLIKKGGVPYLFAVGNHDVTSSRDPNDEGRRLGLANTSAAMANLWPAEGTTRRLTGYPTYSFAYGSFFFIVLDSNIAEDQAQFEWVSAQLQAVDRKRFPEVVAIFHHPPITSGQHGGPTVEPQSETLRRLYMPLFRAHHVRLLLAGHDHLFDHYIERYSDSTGIHRIDHIVTGGGGGPIYRYTGEPDLRRYADGALPTKVAVEHAVRPSRQESDNPHHFVVIQVDGTHLQLRVVSTVAAPFIPYGTDTASLDDPPTRLTETTTLTSGAPPASQIRRR
jgi:calcineurin-like phosphoesterase family protein